MQRNVKIKKEELTQDDLKARLNYDPDTGEFTWLVIKGNINKEGRAGTLGPDGYLQIKVNWRSYKAHRLAWLYIHGEFPEQYIDHINGDRTDNRISNLRQASMAENHQNRAINKSNTSGFIGVIFRKDMNKYQARIKVDRKEKYLGLYDTAELAFEAYKEAKRVLHRFNPEVPLRGQKGAP